MKFVLFYLPSVGSRTQIEKGMAGINTQNYQNMLWQVTKQVQAADDMGYWGAAFTEHHFHVEGFEESNNPILLDLYIAMQTKKIMVGQMANVLPFANPLRLAEDIAMLDQMTRGRAFCGIARGYQRRWADTLGQVYGVQATMSDKSETDKRNRALFEEHFRIIKRLWSEPVTSMETSHWKIPPEGVEFNVEAVKKYGQGVDENGMLHQVGTAPKPYQKPHPLMVQPFSASPETFSFCGKEDIVPFGIQVDESALTKAWRSFQESAEAAGRKYAWGQHIGIFRDALCLPNREEALHWATRAGTWTFMEWFLPLGFGAAIAPEGIDLSSLDLSSMTAREMADLGFTYAGTPDDINRQMEAFVKKFNPEYFLMWQFPGLVPHDVQMRSLETWATEVMPNWMD